MSTKTRKGQRKGYARMIVLNEPLRRRDQPAAPMGPSPACLGGSHRRCLLDATTCACPHHRDEYLYPVPPVAREVFACPVCGVEFDRAWLRVEHVRVSHPVVTTIHDDEWREDNPPTNRARAPHRMGSCRLARCPVCYGDKDGA